jgi:hypothetical protein
MFKEGTRFWTYTIEPPKSKNKCKKVYGTVLYYSQSRDLYVVEWDKTTPTDWINWSNSKINYKNMNVIS